MTTPDEDNPMFDLENRRDGAGMLAAAVHGDHDGFEMLAADLDAQGLHDALMAAVACAAHCMRDTDAVDRLANVIAGAAVADDDDGPPPE